MTIIAKLLSAEKRDVGWKILVEYDHSDGSEVYSKFYSFKGTTLEHLKAFVKTQAGREERIKSADFGAYVGKTLDIEDAPAIEPTAEELAQQAWFNEWIVYLRMQKLVDAGIYPDTDNRYIAQKAKIKTDWLDSYFGGI